MRKNVIIGITGSILIILSVIICISFVQPMQQPQSEIVTSPPKEQDMQIIGVDFCSDGADIIVYFENKGLKSFTFEPDMIGASAPQVAQTVQWSSFPNEIVTVAPQEKLNVTCQHYWKPDSRYAIHADGVYEGTDYRIRIDYETKSPLDYPYFLEIIDVSLSGIKEYDELGALIKIRDPRMTLTVVNHHDTITFDFFKIRPYETIGIGVDYDIAPKETKTFVVPYNWATHPTPTRMYLKASYEVDPNPDRYPFFTGKHAVWSYSNYYTSQSTN